MHSCASSRMPWAAGSEKIYKSSGLALSGAPAPAPPKWEPLAVPTSFISLPRPLPLGEVDANAVSRRRGLGRSPQRGCFRRKPALQMPLSSTTLPMKMQCRTARRLPGLVLIKIILPLNMARAKRKPFKIVRPALPQQRHIICAQRKPHVRQHIIAAGTAAHRASRFWLYSSMET